LEKELNVAKLEGLDAVKNLVEQYRFQKTGYKTWDISSEIASQIVQGKFKNIDEIIDVSFEYNERNITLLYRTTRHPISNNDITIIETFL
jgi:NifU-like protein involved in Fe-S cluster formation